MSRLLPFILLHLLFLPSCDAQEPSKAPQSLPPIEIHFSPKGGCTEAVVKEINAAKTDILVQAYSFTSVPIAKALTERKAHHGKEEGSSAEFVGKRALVGRGLLVDFLRDARANK
jgi:hypothetical protein